MARPKPSFTHKTIRKIKPAIRTARDVSSVLAPQYEPWLEGAYAVIKGLEKADSPYPQDNSVAKIMDATVNEFSSYYIRKVTNQSTSVIAASFASESTKFLEDKGVFSQASQKIFEGRVQSNDLKYFYETAAEAIAKRELAVS